MTEQLWLAILGVVAAQALAVMSPGPSLLVVARTAVVASRAAGAWTAVGLGVGSVVWALAAIFGLQVLFASFPMVYAAAKIAGAGYLLYLAVMLWRHAAAPLPVADGGERKPVDRLRAVRRGITTQLANPKVAVFFGSVFVTLLPPQPGTAVYAVLVCLVFAVETLWYVFVAYALSVRRIRAGYARSKAAIDRLTGAVLAGLGLRLVLDR